MSALGQGVAQRVTAFGAPRAAPVPGTMCAVLRGDGDALEYLPLGEVAVPANFYSLMRQLDDEFAARGEPIFWPEWARWDLRTQAMYWTAWSYWFTAQRTAALAPHDVGPHGATP